MPSKVEARPPTVIVPYDPAWPVKFEHEKQLIQRALKGQVLRIEHIGSTAIPGMPAKPTIDILVAVADFGDLAQYAGALTAIGYVPGRQEMPERWFLKKNVEGIRAYDLHLVPTEGFEQRNEILFRDYLRRYPELAQRYAQLKEELAKQFLPEYRGTYTRAKTAFVQEVVDRARAELELSPVPVWEE